MTTALILFWISLSVLFFSYIGYGGLLYLINALKKLLIKAGTNTTTQELPAVTLIIAAYNEGLDLGQKLENTLAIDYPADQLKIIFVTDGSTDGSEKIIDEHIGVTLLHAKERQGKLAAITRAMQRVETPIVIFSDANAMLNRECIRKIVRHYSDPRIGGVAGEKKIMNSQEPTAVGQAEGMYWKYESFMKKQDAAFYTVTGAAGELFSIRTELFEIPEPSLILDDFIISMKVCLKGYKIAYEPDAFAMEFPSVSLREEMKRKIRIAAGAYQAIGYLRQALNIFKYPHLSFQYISRRVLRWVFCPWMLIILLITNWTIARDITAPGFYSLFLIGQFFFYGLAFIGSHSFRAGTTIGIMDIPYYFVFMNYCLVRGFIRFVTRRQPVLWEKSVREAKN